MGSLYNVTSEPALCCGSQLQKKEETCCMSDNKQLLYATKEGLLCCGHLYYNSSLWSCDAGQPTPQHQPNHSKYTQTNKSRLLSLNNVNPEELCKNFTIGIVESVSQHSIMISNVMQINAAGKHLYLHLPQHYVEIMTDDCSFPQISTGKVYFFDESGFYLNLGSFYQAFYFIISMCQM